MEEYYKNKFLAAIIEDEAKQKGYNAETIRIVGDNVQVKITDGKKRIVVDVMTGEIIQVIMTIFKKMKETDTTFHKHLSHHYLQLFGSCSQGLIQSGLPFEHGFQTYDSTGPVVKYFEVEAHRPYYEGKGYDPKYKRYEPFPDFDY